MLVLACAPSATVWAQAEVNELETSYRFLVTARQDGGVQHLIAAGPMAGSALPQHLRRGDLADRSAARRGQSPKVTRSAVLSACARASSSNHDAASRP